MNVGLVLVTRTKLGRLKSLSARAWQAAQLAALAAPYRHARLSAVKLAGDPNNSAQFKDDATATSYARR